MISRVVASGDVRIALIQTGNPAGETVVLVHGYPDTKEMWAGVIERLSSAYHVVAYDVRGAGCSDAPRGAAAYDFDRLGDDLFAVIGAVSPDRAVHLVGHDWGGIQGWEFAADPRFDGRLASFTTIAGPWIGQLSAGLMELVRRRRLGTIAGRLRRSWYVFALLTPGVPTLAWRGPLGRGLWRAYLARTEAIPVDGRYPAPTLPLDGIHGANLYRRNVLGAVHAGARGRRARVPVQLIVPSEDHFISADYYERAERYAPQLRRRTIQGSHWIPRSDPELVAVMIREFVEQVAGP